MKKFKLHKLLELENKYIEPLYQDRVTYKGINIGYKLIEYLKNNGIEYNFFLTLATNRDNVDLIHFEKSLHQFRTKLCSKCFKAKKYINTDNGKIDYRKLFSGYAFIEKTQTGHVHYHILGYIHPSKLEKITDTPVISDLWKEEFRSGTTNIQKNYDLNGVIDYAMKEFATPYGYKHFVPF